MSREALLFLRQLVVTLHLDVSASDFLTTAQTVSQVLAELDEELAQPTSHVHPPGLN